MSNPYVPDGCPVSDGEGVGDPLEVLGDCEICSGAIYEGDEHFEFGGDLVCEDDLHEYLARRRHWHKGA